MNTKERIEKILNDFKFCLVVSPGVPGSVIVGNKKELTDALIQAGVCFKDEVGKCPVVAKNDIDSLWKLVKQQVDEPSSKTDPYMRGMANGLICALAVFKKWEPIYIKTPKTC